MLEASATSKNLMKIFINFFYKSEEKAISQREGVI